MINFLRCEIFKKSVPRLIKKRCEKKFVFFLIICYCLPTQPLHSASIFQTPRNICGSFTALQNFNNAVVLKGLNNKGF